jgi:hypothetical protein
LANSKVRRKLTWVHLAVKFTDNRPLITAVCIPYRNLELSGNPGEPGLLGGLFLLAGEKAL